MNFLILTAFTCDGRLIGGNCNQIDKMFGKPYISLTPFIW